MKDPATHAQSLPRLHDPHQRVMVGYAGDWEVRDFPRHHDAGHEANRQGMAHVQLWLPSHGVSLLTPSLLTRDRWEAYPIADWKLATPYFGIMAQLLRTEHGVELPSGAEMRRIARWLVARPWTQPTVAQSTGVARRLWPSSPILRLA